MNGIMTLGAYLWPSLVSAAATCCIFLLHHYRQPVCAQCLTLRQLKPAKRARWSLAAARQRRRRYANTVGEPGNAVDVDAPVYPDLVRDVWVSPAALDPTKATPRVRLPRRLPGARLIANPPPRLGGGPYVPRHGHDQLVVATAAYTIVDSPTAEFNRITDAGWDTDEHARLLDSYRCDNCRSNRHNDCPGCECPCTTDAYVEVSRG